MKIAYLHGLESSIDPKDPKIVWLNDNFKSVYTPKIDYKKKGAFSTILRTIKNMDPHYIVGSSMGGYFAYLIGSKLGIKTILFNPAVVGRSFDPFVDDIDTKGRNGHNLFLGKSDNVINGDDVRKFFGDSGMANVNTEYYSGGHRVPVDVFINSIKKVSGVNEIYNNIQNKHKVMKKFEQFVNEKTSFSQMKKDSKTKEYKEVSQAINNAEEVADIWNMLDPKMFKFTESEFEDIFDEWWNNISSYDSIPDFSRNASWEDAHSLYLHLLPYVSEAVVTEKREDVGKYNTVKKVIKELGRRPSEQELASFINNNYYDVTEVERGDDDPQANDKIADLVAFYKFDIDDWEIAWADAQNESVANEAFSRMSKDAIENELYAASQELSKYYDWLKAGNDSGKGKTLDSIISLLKKCKSSIKRFNKPEEVKGTAFESFANEAEDYKYKKNVKLAFDTINDEMFKFRHSLGIKTLTNKDMKLKKKVEVLANVIFDLEKEMKADGLSESKQHSLQTNKINESETVYHKYDFEGMWAQKLGMTREEYVAHFATMTVGVDESSAKDYNGIQFDVKGINFTYTDVGRFYGASVYDVPKTANVSKRAKLSLSEITQFLASIGIKDEVPVRYDTKDLDKICKKLAKKGIVCDHDDSMDVS